MTQETAFKTMAMPAKTGRMDLVALSFLQHILQVSRKAKQLLKEKVEGVEK